MFQNVSLIYGIFMQKTIGLSCLLFACLFIDEKTEGKVFKRFKLMI